MGLPARAPWQNVAMADDELLVRIDRLGPGGSPA